MAPRVTILVAPSSVSVSKAGRAATAAPSTFLVNHRPVKTEENACHWVIQLTVATVLQDLLVTGRLLSYDGNCRFVCLVISVICFWFYLFFFFDPSQHQSPFFLLLTFSRFILIKSWLESDCVLSRALPYWFSAIISFIFPPLPNLSCEINIDDCNGHLCKNGGTCVDEVDSYYCQCPPNFAGSFCDEDIDECEVSPAICKNSATCANTVG